MLSMKDDICSFTVWNDAPIERELSIRNTTLADVASGSAGLKRLDFCTHDDASDIGE